MYNPDREKRNYVHRAKKFVGSISEQKKLLNRRAEAWVKKWQHMQI